ncbi:MAG: pseudaminic acid synthase [Acidobacteriia bacterium]|nr:pseudaminic acid synthase [Terriglobia bacterium]
MSSISIASRPIGPEHRPFIIAEMSGNHNQSLDRALAIVDAAAEAGAAAIKLQTYTADTITMPGAYRIADGDSLWRGKELHQLYQEAYTPWEWHQPIMARAQSLGLVCFSSPFDETAVDFLESLGVPAYKIASFENEHYPLMEKVVRTGKPILMSTGVIELPDLEESVAFLRTCGARDLVLLKCTSTYPANAENANLLTIADMRARFGCSVGLSDHTLGIGAAVAAVALGACVIEKHLTLSRTEGGVDAAFSLEPDELKALVTESERAWHAVGKVSYTLSEKEQKQTVFKRSIYAARDLNTGHILKPVDVRVIRPALGLHPRHFHAVLGTPLRRGIGKGEPLLADHVTLETAPARPKGPASRLGTRDPAPEISQTPRSA